MAGEPRRPGPWQRSRQARARFSEAVPCRRDRRELRRRLQVVAREVREEQKQKVTASLGRLAVQRVPLAWMGPGPGGDETVEFVDGTRVDFDVRDGTRALRCFGERTAGQGTYLAYVEPCFGYCWYWLHFLAAGEDDLPVLVRVDGLESTSMRFWRLPGRGCSHGNEMQ